MQATPRWSGAGLWLAGGLVWFALAGWSGLAAQTPAAGGDKAASTPAYVPPRTPDGQPDMQGHWRAVPGGSYSVEDTGLSVLGGSALTPEVADRMKRGLKNSRIVDPPDGRLPYQPWATERAKLIFDEHLQHDAQFVDAAVHCLPGGPREMYHLEDQILQAPGYVVVLFEFAHAYHVIALNDQAPLAENIKLTMGDAQGRWEGNTLYAESTNFTDKNWLDIVGTFHSDAMRVRERFTPTSPDSINYEVTIEDPKVYTRPWTMRVRLERIKEDGNGPIELLEHACHEGERDEPLLVAPK